MQPGQQVGSAAASSPESPEAWRRERVEKLAPALAVAVLVIVSVARVVAHGFDLVAADDAAYIHVGRELWRLHAPVFIDGSTYTIRSWVYPFLTGGASLVGGSDPFLGSRILGWALATAALGLATIVAARIARGWAAVATAAVLLATPVVWTIVPTTRIDTALACCVVSLLLVVDTPTTRRAIVGGVVAGLALLIKETSAPLVLLPLAYVGVLRGDAWWRFAARYVTAFAVTVSWWFVVVLVIDGEVFPLQGLRQAAKRGVPRSWSLDGSAWLLLSVWVLGWVLLAVWRHREPRARLLGLAALAFVPATAIAWFDELALRQFVPIALLSCIAVGVAATDVIARVVRRFGDEPRRLVAVPLVVGAVAVMAVPVMLTQSRLELDSAVPGLDRELSHWLSARDGTPDVVTTFKFRTPLWVRLDGDAVLHDLGFRTTQRAPDLASAVAIDIRGDGYQTVTRASLRSSVEHGDFLVLTGPGRRGPIGLATWLRENGAAVGLPLAAEFRPEARGPWAYVFRVERPRVDRIPTIVSGFAAEAMLAGDGFHPTPRTTVAGTRGSIWRLRRHVPRDSFSVLDSPAY